MANEVRTIAYLSGGLNGGPSVDPNADCGCSSLDNGPYDSPSADPAPWHDSGRPESADFLGLMAFDIRIDPILSRAVSPRSLGGATIGKFSPRHRLVSIRGTLLARTEAAMSYGERWLNDVLAGEIVGCAPDTIRILLSCPDDPLVDEAQFRTLRRVGTVDGPSPSPIFEMPECYIQEVFFQLAAGVPYLLTDTETCLAETTLGSYS